MGWSELPELVDIGDDDGTINEDDEDEWWLANDEICEPGEATGWYKLLVYWWCELGLEASVVKALIGAISK